MIKGGETPTLQAESNLRQGCVQTEVLSVSWPRPALMGGRAGAGHPGVFGSTVGAQGLVLASPEMTGLQLPCPEPASLSSCCPRWSKDPDGLTPGQGPQSPSLAYKPKAKTGPGSQADGRGAGGTCWVLPGRGAGSPLTWVAI